MMLVLLGLLMVRGEALAHRINVFAWAEGDTVYVEAKYGGGKKIRSGTVIVTDTKGLELLRGKTDNQGAFSFRRPQASELKIILDAGSGHRAHWILPTDDDHADHAPDEPLPHEIPGDSYAGLNQAEIEAIVEKVLDKKMKPLIKMLSESQKKGPGLGDIIGGIGYIIGLVGIAAYFHSRKKNS